MTDEIIITEDAYQLIREDYFLLTKKADQIADMMFELAKEEELPNYYEDLCKCVVWRFTDKNIHYSNLIDGTEITLPASLLSYPTDQLYSTLKLILRRTF